jgi:allantoate deiminase
MAGIEILQSMNEKGIMTKHPMEVCAFRDEEGCRFNFSLLGSRGMTGRLKPEDLVHKDNDGITIAQAMSECGLNPEEIFRAARRPGEIKAYLELHVEQGKVLECAGVSVGVVTGIASSLRVMVTVTGKADHAGATPMNMRYDALAAAAQIINIVETEARETGSAVEPSVRFMLIPEGLILFRKGLNLRST